MDESREVNAFHKVYYGSGVWNKQTTYKGIKLQKCPLDLWIYQDIFYEYKPELVVELGTGLGGSSMWMHDVLDAMNINCPVITIDHNNKRLVTVSSVHYVTDSSINPAVFGAIRSAADNCKTIVILDSNHHKEHVLKELDLYHRLIQVGGYLIVEDTNLNGHPVRHEHGAGPMEAVQEFLKEHGDKFIIDHSREKFMLTFNPNGYLKRIR